MGQGPCEECGLDPFRKCIVGTLCQACHFPFFSLRGAWAPVKCALPEYQNAGSSAIGRRLSNSSLFPLGRIDFHCHRHLTLHMFDWIDGNGSTSLLIQATNGTFYGTSGSGTNGHGQYTITPASSFKSIYSFNGIGGPSHASLIRALTRTSMEQRRALAEVESAAGSDRGRIFHLTPGGTFAVLH